MLGLLLLASFGTLAVGGAFDEVFGLSEDEDRDLDRIDADEAERLLDPSALAELEAALLDDPAEALAGREIAEVDISAFRFTPTDAVDFTTTDEAEYVSLPDDLDDPGQNVVFLGGGDDVALGSVFADVISGDDGNDLIFGRDGFDQLFGDAGDDTISGGSGGDALFTELDGDLILPGTGADVVFGDGGDDNIIEDVFSEESLDPDGVIDVFSGGDGNDGIMLATGLNLLSLGAGADHVEIDAEYDDAPAAVITDFDPEEDGLLLSVYTDAPDLGDGATALEITYLASQIETSLGPATLVEPAVESEELAETLAGANALTPCLWGSRPRIWRTRRSGFWCRPTPRPGATACRWRRSRRRWARRASER
ncbi:calcium-binding protein [Litorisediminicola beolgyonensis]|uniref:Calcium-binding protein n=1 Tax=Litorisediminicola beolgyonensis TaxID=1173614 RepID=A0ABW3ZLT1_9RHOB